MLAKACEAGVTTNSPAPPRPGLLDPLCVLESAAPARQPSFRETPRGRRRGLGTEGALSPPPMHPFRIALTDDHVRLPEPGVAGAIHVPVPLLQPAPPHCRYL